MRRRRLKKATPAGPKKEAPGVKFDPPRGPISRPGESQTGFWRPPGARSASGGRSGREKGSWKIVWRALGTVFGVLLAPLRPVSDRLSPPWGGPGEAPGGHFWRYFGVIFGSVLENQAEKVKMIIFKNFNVILDPFSILFIALCCLPCCVAGGAAHMQKS